MADLPNLVENIRTALAYSESVSPDKLSDYARQYAEECTKLNDRLKQCLPHLRSGNIAEAVRIAEASPSVIEAFSQLDFETRQDWHEVCDGLGLDVAPPLAVEIFQELNDAYLKMTSIEPLLKWHRILALNGSPLRERLAVLRSIAQADPMNLHWQTDQETFERVRINELRQEVVDALAKKDMSRLQELYRELTAPGWIITPPPEYRLKICTAVLEKRAEDLMQRFSAFDYSAANAVYQSMQQVIAANRMAMPTAIEQHIRPAVQWMQETVYDEMNLEQFQREIEKLQEALDVYAPRETLENLYFTLQNSAGQVNKAIPKELESHYHSRIDHLDCAEKYRFYTVVSVFVGSLVLVAAIFIYAFMERSFAEQVETALKTLQKIEEENLIDDIDRTFKTIKPKVAKSPKVEPVMTRLQGILDKDNERAKEFERYRTQADLLMDQKYDMEGLKAARSSIDQANRLKRTAQEITLFTDLRSKYDRLFSQLQSDVDRDFSSQFTRYSQEFNNLPRTPSVQYPLDKLIAELNTLTANVKNLLAQYPDISEKQKREGNTLLTSIANRLQAIQQRATETDTFQQIAAQIRDLPSCKRVLQDFSTRFPSHSASNDIKEMLNNFDQIQGVAESLQALCQTFAASSNDYLWLRNAATDIKNRYDTVAVKITNIETVFSPTKHVSTLAGMKPIDATTFKATEELLKTIARRDLYPWIDARNNWYYLTSKPPFDDAERMDAVRNNIKPEFVTTLISTPKEYSLNIRDTDRNKGNYDLIQSAFAREALVQLDKITTDPNMQKDTVAIICELLVKMNKTPGIDPILKVILLHSFISDYSKIDPIFAENFQRVMTLINGGGVDLGSNWLDVEARDTIPERQRASVILSRLTGAADLQTLTNKTKKETDEFRQGLSETSPKFEFVGLLTKQDRQWSLSQIGTLPSASGNLFVLQMSGDKVQAIQIGSVRNNSVTLSNTSNVLQCSPVFFVN